MKRLILTLAAAAAVAAPMAASAQDWRNNSGRDRDGRYEGRRDYDGRQNGRGDRDGRSYNNGQRYDDRRGGYDGRWDGRRSNGYYYNNRWNYGPPPQAYYGRPGYRAGYQQWRRGGYLPQYYRGYVVNDYGRYGLRSPPRGYYWYNSGNDYILAAIATGLIFDVITR